jgi:hypothetical protein
MLLFVSEIVIVPSQDGECAGAQLPAGQFPCRVHGVGGLVLLNVLASRMDMLPLDVS